VLTKQIGAPRFTQVLKQVNVKISMDGKGRWMDNVFIERLWRSLKYECVYLHAFETGTEARKEIGAWMKFYGTALIRRSPGLRPMRPTRALRVFPQA
jgi:putative transposase